MSKRDRQGVRTPSDIERKYDLGKLNAFRGDSQKQELVLTELTQKVDQFIADTNGNLEDVNAKIDDINNDISGFNGAISELNSKYTALDNKFNELGAAVSPKIGYVTLLADAWEGANIVYQQVVEIEGVTENSQVDLTPNIEQLAIFYEKDLSFVTENENGIVTVYAIGQKPLNDYTIQVTITEVYI